MNQIWTESLSNAFFPYLDEQVFVVELLELLEECVPEGEGLRIALCVVVEPDQPGLQRLAEEDALLVLGPLDAVLERKRKSCSPVVLIKALGSSVFYKTKSKT